MTRYAVIRCPSSGPPALVGAPNVFGTKSEALARIKDIEKEHRKAHHTFLDVVAFDGSLVEAMEAQGISI